VSISTYSDLLTAIAKFAWRDDAEFTSGTSNFVSLAESRLNRELPLRVMETDTAISIAKGGQTAALPSDFVEPIALHLTTFDESTPLKPSIAGTMPIKSGQQVPTAWCVNGANLQVDAVCDQNHTSTFRYRKAFNLSPSSPTNWLLAHHPDVYLAASLVWGNVFMMNPEMAAPWKAMLDEALEEISWKEARSRVGTLSVDAALVSRGGYNINYE
jgi:hypothetical protein